MNRLSIVVFFITSLQICGRACIVSVGVDHTLQYINVFHTSRARLRAFGATARHPLSHATARLGAPNRAVANFWQSQKLAKADGAPGRTRTSTTSRPPD